VQCGIYLGMENRIAAMLDHSLADLWVVPLGTKSFDDPSLLSGTEKYAILSTPGVAAAEELVVGFASWRKFSGGSTVALVVGSDTRNNASMPWDIAEGTIGDLSAPSAIAIDRTYFRELGIERLGDHAEINYREVTVRAATQGIRSFTTLPTCSPPSKPRAAC
jgi:putative ABC transport system permease protein